MSQKAVVTGGAGFIGSHLVELLLKEGFKVTAIDNMSNGQKENVELFSDNDNYIYLEMDVNDVTPDLFEGVDYVFHLAALADIVPSVKEPQKYHDANVNGTLKILEACKNANIKKFVYSASSSCYGIPDMYPTPESAPIKPQYPYALTKYVGEEYVLFWNKLYDLPAVSLRLFNVYGPRARTNDTYGAVFKVFLAQKLHNLPLTIVGDGSQTRDFTFVTDVASAFLEAARSDVSGEIINIGTGNPQTVSHLADLIGGERVSIPKRPGEPDITHADVTKANNLLKWEAKISFEEGVKIMLDNIEYWRDAPVFDVNKIKEATKDWFKYLGDKN